MQTDSYLLFKAYTPPTNEVQPVSSSLALKVKTEKLHVNYLPPSICGSGSIFFGFYVQVASMYEKKNVCEFNEKFLQCEHRY